MKFSILTIQKDMQGIKIIRRYEHNEMRSLRNALGQCYFMALCFPGRNMISYAILNKKGLAYLNLEEARNKMLSVGMKEYHVDAVFKVNNENIFQIFQNQMIEFVERTNGIISWGSEIENYSRIQSIKNESVEVVKNWYYIF